MALSGMDMSLFFNAFEAVLSSFVSQAGCFLQIFRRFVILLHLETGKYMTLPVLQKPPADPVPLIITPAESKEPVPVQEIGVVHVRGLPFPRVRISFIQDRKQVPQRLVKVRRFRIQRPGGGVQYSPDQFRFSQRR
jgi:hypothetical protein